MLMGMEEKEMALMALVATVAKDFLLEIKTFEVLGMMIMAM